MRSPVKTLPSTSRRDVPALTTQKFVEQYPTFTMVIREGSDMLGPAQLHRHRDGEEDLTQRTQRQNTKHPVQFPVSIFQFLLLCASA